MDKITRLLQLLNVKGLKLKGGGLSQQFTETVKPPDVKRVSNSAHILITSFLFIPLLEIEERETNKQTNARRLRQMTCHKGPQLS